MIAYRTRLERLERSQRCENALGIFEYAPDGECLGLHWAGIWFERHARRHDKPRASCSRESAQRPARMADLGYEVVGGTPEDMAEMIGAEVKRMEPIVRASGAKPE